MIGRTIYENRKQKGLTLSELAERAKISKSYLSNIERNLNRNPSIKVVGRIAEVLNIELNLLLDSETNDKYSNNLDLDLIELATELKETGIEKEQLKDYKTLIEFIKWQKLSTREEKKLMR